MISETESMVVGVNLMKRMETIKALANHPLRMQRFRFRGANMDMPVISVQINLPVYRIGNRRTKTLQEEYVVNHPELQTNFFETDEDSIAVQTAQDEILRFLIDDKDLYDVFTNPKTQQDEPIICTRSGVVVNGNRRLCAWRKLYEEDRVKYSHFESVEIMLLPEDTEESDINNIERDLQIKRAIKADYSWHARANMIKLDYQRVRSINDLKQMYEMSRQELQLAMDCYDYAKSYLESIHKPGQWSLVDKHEFAFQKIVKEKSKISGTPKQRMFEACAAAVLQADSDILKDRRYDIIPQIAKNLVPIIDVLKRDMPTGGGNSGRKDPFGFCSDDSDSATMYALEHECRKPENIKKTVDIISSVIEAANQTRRDDEASHALFIHLKQISTELISVKNSDLNDRQEDMPAVKNQLKSIMKACEDIAKWVDRHETHT